MIVKTPPKFKDLLSKYRNRENLSKTNLAQKIGVTVSYIIDIEAGRKRPPPFEMCEKISKTLNISLEEQKIFYKAAWDERTGESDDKFIQELRTHVKLVGDKAEKIMQKIESRSDIPPDILAALQDPIAVKALLATHKNTQDIKNTIKVMLEYIPNLSQDKRQAIISLCK
jgi:transcriptional regulator with XRE-family HTH domain